MPSPNVLSGALVALVGLAAAALGTLGLISPDPMLLHGFWPLILMAAGVSGRRSLVGAALVIGGVAAVLFGLSSLDEPVSNWVYAVPLVMCMTAAALYSKPPDHRKRQRHTAILETMVQSAPRALLAYIDAQGVCRFASNGFRRHWGREPVDIVGVGIEELFGEQNHPQIADDFFRARMGEQRRVELGGADNGPFRWFTLSLQPYFGDDDRVQGVIVLITDSTAHREAEFALTEMTLTLERRVEERTFLLQQKMIETEAADRARADFSEKISNRLRGPLNSLLCCAELLQKQVYGALGDPRYLDHGRRIRERALTLLDFADQLQEISTVEGSAPEIALGPFDLRDVCEAVAPLAAFMAERKGVSLSFPSPAISAGVIGNFDATKRILTNLVDNAIKYSVEGGRVRVSFSSTRDVLDLRVEDDGRGMTPADIERAMSPLEDICADLDISEKDGAGLGLSVVKSFAAKQETPFELEAGSPAGLCATVRFRRADLNASRAYGEDLPGNAA